MSKNKAHITTDNLSEWMNSVGYFLPTNDLEINRFERLHTGIELTEKEVNQVDPISIINGKWKPTTKVISLDNDSLNHAVNELRMAARKQQGLPDHILDRIKKNQNNNGSSSKSEE